MPVFYGDLIYVAKPFFFQINYKTIIKHLNIDIIDQNMVYNYGFLLFWTTMGQAADTLTLT